MHRLQPSAPAGTGEAGAQRVVADRPAQWFQRLEDAAGDSSVAALEVSCQAQVPARIEGRDPAKFGLLLQTAMLEHVMNLGILRGTHHAGSRCDHRGLFRCNRRQGGAEVLTVIQADVGHGDQRTLRMGGGGIQPSTEPHLQHQQVHVALLKMHQGSGQQLLERGQPEAVADRCLVHQQLAQIRQSDRLTIDADPFAPTHQMGGGGDAGADVGLLQSGAEKAGDRSLAVGAGHLDRRCS